MKLWVFSEPKAVKLCVFSEPKRNKVVPFQRGKPPLFTSFCGKPPGRAASTIVVRHRFTPPASAIGAPAPPSRASSTASPPTSEPQELPAATLDTIRHHDYHPSARRSTPTPPEQKHEHHDEPCRLYPSPDAFAPSEHHGPRGPAHLPRLPRRVPGCIGARAACQAASAGLRPLSRPPRIRGCPVPARLRCPSRQGFAGPLRLVKAEPATLNLGRKQR